MSRLAPASYSDKHVYDDLSVSEIAGGRARRANGRGEEQDDDEIIDLARARTDSGRVPLNSTLMTDQIPSHFASTDRRYRARDRRTAIPAELFPGRRSGAAASAPVQDRDLTLSTQTESVLDEMDNVIPGVGAGHVRQQRDGIRAPTVDKILHRRLEVHHPSPSTAAKHHQVFARPGFHHDSDDSESVAESSSQSAVSMSDGGGARPNPFHHTRPFNESTGNHQGFMRSPGPAHTATAKKVSEPVRNLRPKLPTGWQKGFDDLSMGGKIKKPFGRSFAPATDGAESGSNESGYAPGRHPQSAYDGRRRPGTGTEGSTSGETLVGGDGGRAASSAPYDQLRLPSGQAMGKGVPSSGFSIPHDLSGMSAALESPLKARVGVEHRTIDPQSIQAFAVPTVQHRQRAFDDINSYIHRVEKKVDRVDDVSQDVYREIGSLRKEWLEWRDKKHHSPFKHAKQPQAPTHSHKRHKEEMEEEQREESAVDDNLAYRERLAGAQKMASEIGESMEYYRNTLADLRREELILIEREKNRKREKTTHLAPHRTSPPAVFEGGDEDEKDLNCLRMQVDAVAKQVDRLRVMVYRKDSERAAAYSANSPIKPSHRRSIGVGNDNPFVQRRKVSSESAKSSSSNVRTTSHAAQSPRLSGQQDDYHAGHEPDVADLSHLADARAVQAEDRIAGHHPDTHDVKRCMHCVRQAEKQRRATLRREAASAYASGTSAKERNPSSSSSASEFVEADARALLEKALEEMQGVVGSESTPALLRLAQRQRSLLERTIAEEMDDFYHAKCTYLDLADEFKSFSPDLNSAKRRILAEHVMIAVEGLEMRADRVERLRAALAATLPKGGHARYDEDDRIYPGTARGAHSKTATSHARNTPPIVDDEVAVGSRDDNFPPIFMS